MLVGERNEWPIGLQSSGGANTTIAPDITGGAEFQEQFSELDKELDRELANKNLDADCAYSERVGAFYLNSGVAERVRPDYRLGQLQRLESHLRENGTLTVPITYGTLRLREVEHAIPVIAATETDANHGEMSSMLYLRDHIQTAEAFMRMADADPKKYAYEGRMGKELLISALHLMSTPKQLERQQFVIEHGKDAGQFEWPNISLMFDDLEGEGTVEWRHKQDTIYMLHNLALTRLSDGTLPVTNLTDAHKQFMGNMLPFIAATGYPDAECNSGSWEEFDAPGRTSVTAIQVAMLHKQYKMTQRTDRDQFDFLRSGFETHMHGKDGIGEYGGEVHRLMHAGLVHIGKQLPHETPNETDPIRRRGADAALTYLLRYDIPARLAEYQIPTGKENRSMSEYEIEDMLLQELDILMDSSTGGMRRYEQDSYQRQEWFTHSAQASVRWVKKHVKEVAARTGKPIDFTEKQRLRHQKVPKGREAMWTHPVNQISSWAASKYMGAVLRNDRAAERRYKRLCNSYLNQGLRTVTGNGQYHLELNADGNPTVAQTKAYRYPEAIVTHNGKLIASPHNPLNWSTAMSAETFGIYGAGLKHARARRVGRLGIGNRSLNMRTDLSRLVRHAFVNVF